MARVPYLRLLFDGSADDKGTQAAWILYGSEDPGPDDDNWKPIAFHTIPMCKEDTPAAAELEAMRAGVRFAELYVRAEHPRQLAQFCREWRACTGAERGQV